MSGIMLVGEMPSKKGDGTPFSGPSGDRLTRVLGRDWREVIEAQNIYPERREWDSYNAESIGMYRRQILFPKRYPGWHVLLAGRKVEKAFGFKREPYFQRLVRHGVRYYVIPHPSGLSRYWNEPENVMRFSEFLNNLVKEVREG